MSETPDNSTGLSADRAIVSCPNCEKAYRVPVRLVGRRLICKHCRHQWRAAAVDSGLIAARQANAAEGHAEQASDSGQTDLDEQMPISSASSSVAIDMSWAGRRLGRYQVRSLLGYGGMGVVWRAHDDSLRRDVALKILSQTRDDRSRNGLNLDLFLQEARAVAKLQHPSVVSIYEVGEDQAHVYLALELMEGGTLREFVERHGPISPRKLFGWLVGPARALALAHRRGVIHRDIKPGNLMFDDHGHMKLMDFGLADVSDEAVSERLRGRAVGSLGWIAPETARGRGTTPQSDLYCFGLVMMYALTGKPFINARTKSEVIRLHQNPPEPELSEVRGLTSRARQLLLKCLAVKPEERYASADELARDLAACAEEDPAQQRQRRRRGMSMAVAATVLGAVAGIGLTLHYAVKLINQDRSNRLPVTLPQQAVIAEPATPVVATSPASTGPADGMERPAAPPTSGRTGFSTQRVPWPEVLDGRGFRFVASAGGKVFHRADHPDCGARKIFACNLIVYDSVAQAVADGRTPCTGCRPDNEAKSGKAGENVAVQPED